MKVLDGIWIANLKQRLLKVIFLRELLFFQLAMDCMALILLYEVPCAALQGL